MSINNVITNSSFETGTLAGWNFLNTTVIPGKAHLGDFAAHFSSGAVQAYISQIVPAQEASQFELFVSFANSITQNSPTIELEVLFLDSNDAVIGIGLSEVIAFNSIPFIGDDTWLEIYRNTDAAPVGTTQVLVRISKPVAAFNAPSILVDDVELLEAIGGVGPTGATGPIGPTADNFTETSAFAGNSQGEVIGVEIEGIDISLPDDQNLNNITVDGTNTVFTINETGTYYLTYQINLTEALLVGSRLVINGTSNDALTINPLLTVANFNADMIINLTADTTITLQLFGLSGAATLQDGAGAALSIIRLA
jgi:hypothetical protein